MKRVVCMRPSRLVAVGLSLCISMVVGSVGAQPGGTGVVAGSPALRGLPDFTDLVDKTGPAVVNIRTTEKVRGHAGSRSPVPGLDENDPFYEFFRRFLPPGQAVPRGRAAPERDDADVEVPSGVGSGFVISADGVILTNAHVVDGAESVLVTLADKREFKAKVLGADKRTDVAVIKIDAGSLPKVSIGNVEEVRPGQWVLAIGSPFGLDNTVTAGIVSAKGRDTGEYLPFIQTDVAVNPGNSGGPLLNLKGEVIGINSQIYSRTGGFMGISFAIPIDEAMRVADQLRSTGRVSRGRIGVGIDEVSKEVAEALGVKPVGAMIRQVEKGGPADKAGLEAGDILLKWQGKAIERSTDLPRTVGNTRPGTAAVAQIWRKGQVRDVTITVAEADADKPQVSAKSAPGERGKTPAEANALGLVVADIPEAKRAELRIRGGVLVEAVEGPAARAGLRAGDIILSINSTDVQSARQFNELVSKVDRGRTSVLLVRRGDSAQFVPIKPNGK